MHFYGSDRSFAKVVVVCVPIHSMAHQDPVCGCDCARSEFIILRAQVPDNARCQCPFCGVPGEDLGCIVLVSPVAKAMWFVHGGKLPRTSQEMKEAPLLCEDCMNHAAFLFRREAVKRMQAKRKEDEKAQKPQGV